MSEINLKIPELKNMLKEVHCITGINYSQYAFSFIKRRAELFMTANSINTDVDFIYKINKSPGFAGQFLETAFVTNSEFFRDAEMWNFLESKLFPKFKGNKQLSIHFPHCSGGKELYSLLYILSKSLDNKNIFVTVSSVTDLHLKEIKTGEYSGKDVKASVKNIELLNSADGTDDIFHQMNKIYKVKTKFKGELKYETCDFFKGKYITDFDIVFFRNNLIYFNSELHEKAIKVISRSLKKNGYLIIGSGETLGETEKKKYKQINKDFNIFKKKSI